ncbi:MAG: recombinase family protein [[Eubacterium] siraeum]
MFWLGKEMVINPEQAKTVRMIFDMYLDGMGLKSIKYELESRGRLTAMGKTQWFESVISKVLRNSFYCGIMAYHKYYCPDYLKQNRVKNMGEIEMTYTKGTHEPIVTEEEFNLVQARMDARTRQLNNCQKGKRVAPKREPATIWGNL